LTDTCIVIHVAVKILYRLVTFGTSLKQWSAWHSSQWIFVWMAYGWIVLLDWSLSESSMAKSHLFLG